MLHAAAPRPRTSASRFQVQIVRIERRIDEYGGALALTEHLDEEPGADGGEPGIHVTDRKALAEYVSVAAGGRATDDAFFAVEQWLVAERIRVSHVVHLERDERLRHARRELPLERVATDEIPFLHPHEAPEPGFEGCVVAREIAPPHAVGLLEAQRVHGPHADHADAEFLASREQLVEQVMCVLDRKVQLPAEGADEIDAQRVHVDGETDFDRATAQPRKRRVVERHIDELRQHVARPRTRDDEAAARAGHVAQYDGIAARQPSLKVVGVVALCGPGTHHVELIFGQLRDRELGTDATALRERVTERHAARLRRNLVRDESVEPLRRARPADLVLGERRQVDDPDPLAQHPAFVADVLKIVAAPETPDIAPLDTRRREPVGTFPPIALAEDRAHALQPGVDGTRLRGTRILAFLVRVVNREDVTIGFLVLRDDVAAARVGPEAARVDGEHVNARLAFDDPLRKLPARTAGGRDAEAVALVEPEVAHFPGRPYQRTAVRRVADRAVDNVLDAAGFERRHTPLGRLDVRQ